MNETAPLACEASRLEAQQQELLSLQDRLRALETSLSTIYDEAPFGSHSLNADQTFADVNAVELAWLECSRDELIGKRQFTDYLAPEDARRYREYMQQHRHRGFSHLEMELIGQRGARHPVSVHFHGHMAPDGSAQRDRSILLDMSEKRQWRERQRMAALAFESASGICITDPRGRVQMVNQAFSAMTGYSAQEIVGRTMRMLRSGLHGPEFYAALWDAILRRDRWQGEIQNRRKNGELFTEWLHIATVRDQSGQIANFVGSFYDITEIKATQAEISQMAYHDALTQLPNRRLLVQRIEHATAMSSRNGSQSALLFVDLDHFKTINDTRGHEAGDQLLIATAQRIRATVREGDTVARVGGDEFVVLLEGLGSSDLDSATQARQVGEKLLLALAVPYPFANYEFRCTASIGINMMTAIESVEEQLKRADLAMYQAKKLGRNGLRFFDPHMQSAVAERVGLTQDLHCCVEGHELELHFQPQVNDQLVVIGAEALLRWHHPQRGTLMPGEFIPLAEDTGLIHIIGSWVLRAACAQLRAWQASATTHDLTLAVNVSAIQFAHADFLPQTMDIIRHSGIDGRGLQIEVTESALLHIDSAVQKMNALGELGVTFALDDFGTGYSSLSNLTRLPISQLKIDLSFVRNMDKNLRDEVIVRTIIGMAKSLGLQVLAEGVETHTQMDQLAAFGCDLYQGYLIGRPVAQAEFQTRLSATGSA